MANEDPKSPAFKTFPQSATVQEGESVRFECETEKAPQNGEFFLTNYSFVWFLIDCIIFFVAVTWIKDGSPVDIANSRFQFVQEGKCKFKFEINKCKSDDMGQYTAKAQSSKGETLSSFSLNVVPHGEL